MVMNALRKGAAGGIFKFIIFGFLTLAVGGLVLMDVGGFFRGGGIASNDVARAGNHKISIMSFDRTVRRNLQNIGIGPKEAYKAGYIDQVLNAEIRASLMEQSAADSGVIIDKKHIAHEVSSMIQPMVKQGESPKDVLKQILINQGMSERELTDAISQQITLTLMDTTIRGGFAAAQESMVQDLYAWQNEKRDIVYVSLAGNDSEVKPPSDEELKQLYEKVKENFAQDEMRTFKLIGIKTDKIKSSIDVTDEEIRSNYDSNIDQYSEEEQKTIEQALLDTEDQAKAVAEKTKAGTALKDAVKDATGKTTAYLGEKSFETGNIPSEIKEPVNTAKSEGELVGPVKTPLGWQVIVVKKISAAQTKSFESVKQEIKDELIENKSIDQVYALASTVDDMLASGSSLEDIKKEVDIDVKDLPPINHFGQDKDGKDALKDEEKTRNFIIETGFQLEEKEASPMSEMGDGTFVGIYVDAVQPKSYKPFEEVKETMSKRWIEDQRLIERKAKALEALDKINKEKQSPEDYAKATNKTLQRNSGIARMKEAQKPLTDQSVSTIFMSEEGKAFLLELEDGDAIGWIVKTTTPEKIDTSSKEFSEFRDGVITASQNEGMASYIEKKRQKYGAAVNHDLLERAYGQENASY